MNLLAFFILCGMLSYQPGTLGENLVQMWRNGRVSRG